MISNSGRSVIRRVIASGGLAVAILLLLSAPPKALASSWFVNLAASTDDGGDPTSVPPFQSVSGNLTYNSNTGSTVTIGPAGTTTYSAPTVLGLTSALIQTSSSQTIDNYCSGPSGCVSGTLTASAMAKGNLATGSVGVYSLPSAIGGYAVSDADTNAQIADQLMFSVAGATPSTVTDIGVTFTVDGSLSYNNSMGTGALMDAVMELGATISYGYNSANNPNPNQIIENSGWVSSNIVSESPDSFIFNGVFAVNGASETVPVFLELLAQCEGESSCDFSNTGAISLTLPSNVTFTSASGVFLTQPLGATATPEPSSGVLLLGVLLGVGVVLKRHRHAVTI